MTYSEPPKPIRPLTDRQSAVADALARGCSYREIGVTLGITPRAVKAHVQAIAARLPNPHRLPAGRLVMLWAARHIQQDHTSCL